MTTSTRPLADHLRWSEIRRLEAEQRMDAAGLDLLSPYELPTCTLEAAGLEETDAPIFGFDGNEGQAGGVQEYLLWANDGEDSRYETN